MAQYLFAVLLGLAMFLQTGSQLFAGAILQRFYSPIVKIEADKGVFLVTTDSGIQWIQVKEKVKATLKTLDVGDMIDIVVEMRANNNPPLLKSWKLARGASSYKVFDGKVCSK